MNGPPSNAWWCRPISLFQEPAKTPWTNCFADHVAVSVDEVPSKEFSKRIAFNLIPHIDVFMEYGLTKEEWKMVVETKKILDPKFR